MLSAKVLIERLGLVPLAVEGGLFRQTWLSSDRLSAEGLPVRYGRVKAAGSAIYYLLTDEPDSFSALHRLPTDEIYHFYLGDPVEMLLLHGGTFSERVTLGQDVLEGHHLQFVVPRDTWQGSRLAPGGRFALLGTTMAPAYDDQDYEGGDRAELVRRYPDQADRIRSLTRAP